jgi:hypothetical protein
MMTSFFENEARRQQQMQGAVAGGKGQGANHLERSVVGW